MLPATRCSPPLTSTLAFVIFAILPAAVCAGVPETIAYTEIETPPVGATSHIGAPYPAEMGFSGSYLRVLNNIESQAPANKVLMLDTPTTSARQISALFDSVDLSGYGETAVSLDWAARTPGVFESTDRLIITVNWTDSAGGNNVITLLSIQGEVAGGQDINGLGASRRTVQGTIPAEAVSANLRVRLMAQSSAEDIWVDSISFSGTQNNGGSPQAPGVPQNLTISPNSPTVTNTLLLSWNPVAEADYYDVQLSSTGPPAYAWQPPVSSTGTQLLKSVLDGIIREPHYYRVAACNAAGCSSYSGAVGMDPRPSSLSASPNPSSDGDFVLSWAAVSGATDYRVRYDDPSGEQLFELGGTSLAQQGMSVGSHWYEAAACQPGGELPGVLECTEYSDALEVTVTNPEPPPSSQPPGTPTGFSVPSSDADGRYFISWSGDPDATYYVVAETENLSLPTGSWRQFEVGHTSASPPTSFLFHRGADVWYYRLSACNEAGCSGWTPTSFINVAVGSRGFGQCGVAGNGDISLVSPGRWQNDGRVGSGLDIFAQGAALVTRWYSYLDGGYPVWYNAVSPDTDALANAWSANLYEFNWDWNASGEPYGALADLNLADDNTEGEVIGKVYMAFDNANHSHVNMFWTVDGGVEGHTTYPRSGQECFHLLLEATGAASAETYELTEPNYSGMWHEPGRPGYGLSVVRQLEGPVYGELDTLALFDSQGRPVWAQGISDDLTNPGAVPGPEVTTFDMSAYSGYCVTCTPPVTNPTARPAGFLTRQFVSADEGVLDTSGINLAFAGISGLSGKWLSPGGVCIESIANITGDSRCLPNVPQSVNVTGDFGTGVLTVSWVPDNGGEPTTYYKLSEKQVGVSAWSDVNTSISAGTTTYNVNQSSGDWRFGIRACNANGCSGRTSSDTVTVGGQPDPDPDPDPDPGPGLIVPDQVYTPKPPPAHDPGVGAIAGAPGVSGGSATFSIPIAIPPGRRGMQPALSLEYNSGSGNGYLGVGWSLSGLSSIHRCPQTVAQDGQTRAVQFDDQDRLCLDGQRLVAVDGTYGAGGTQYRTELESFARVTQNGALFSAASGFTLETRSGVTRNYGYAVVLGNGNEPLSWLLTLEEDLHGNNIKYAYGNGGAGETFLQRIDYTGYNGSTGTRRVEFAYVSRGDVSSSWLAGRLTTQTQLLYTITTHAPQQVRQYTLQYAGSAASGRSLLSIVTECAGGSCLPSLEFAWQQDAPVFDPVPITRQDGTVISDEDGLQLSNDFDGDGSRDFLLWADVAVDGNEGEPGQQIYYVRPQGLEAAPDSISLERLNSVLAGRIQVDIDQDGITDLLGYHQSSGQLAIVSIGNLNNPVLTGIPFSRSEGATHQAFVGDFNADGEPDVLVETPESTGLDQKRYLDIWLNCHGADTGCVSGFRKTLGLRYQLASSSYSDGLRFESVYAVTDLDGDGRSDLITTHVVNTSSKTLRTLFSNGDASDPYLAFGGIPTGLPGNLSLGNGAERFFAFADLNGDGLDDFLTINSGVWAAQVNRGDRTFADISLTAVSDNISPGASAPFRPVKLLDWDNDGRTELLLPGPRVHTYCVTTSLDDIGGINQLRAPEDTRTPEGGFPADSCTSTGSPSETCFCGDDFYDSNFNNSKGLAFAPYDRSIHSWSALDFRPNANGGVTGFLKADVLEAAISATAGDYRGDGLSDLYGPVGNQTGVPATWSGQGSPPASVYGRYRGNSLLSDPAYTAAIVNNISLGARFAFRNAGEAPDLLSAASTRAGAGLSETRTLAQWLYDPLSREPGLLSLGQPLYAVDHTADVFNDGAHFQFASSMYVVTAFSRANGRALNADVPGEVGDPGDGCDGRRDLNTIYYGYRNAVYNHEGRGFQGFESIIEEACEPGLRAVSTFSQQYPLAGRLIEQYSELTSDIPQDQTGAVVPISYSETFWEAPPTPNDGLTLHPRITRTVTDTFEPRSRKPVSNATTEGPTPGSAITYDAFGNVTYQRVLTGDAWIDHVQTSSSSYAVSAALESAWWLDKLTGHTVTQSVTYKRAPASPLYNSAKSTTQSFTYHGSDRLLASQTTSSATDGAADGLTLSTVFGAQGTGQCSSQAMGYDQYGNACYSTVSGTGITQARTTEFGYTTDGYFVDRVVNPEGHVSTTLMDAATGQPVRVTGPNGLVVAMDYDAFGREIAGDAYPRLAAAPAGSYPRAMTGQSWCSGDCNGAEYRIARVQDGTPASTAYLDRAGRTVRVDTTSFGGGINRVQSSYDALGRLQYQTEPYDKSVTSDASAPRTTYTAYDALGRLLGKRTDKDPDPTTGAARSLLTSYDYADLDPAVDADITGLRTGITVTGGSRTLTMSRVYNTLDQLMETVDALGSRSDFRYDGQGNPILIEDPDNNATRAEYNGLGQRERLEDPNMGTWSFGYNAAGELTSQTDARGIATSYQYDPLGRQVARTANGLTDQWFFDEGGETGLLTRIHKGNGSDFTRSFEYDTLKRPVTTRTRIAGTDYTVGQQYHGYFGRPKGLSYPDGTTIYQRYDADGYLTEEGHAADWTNGSQSPADSYRQVLAMSARGQVTREAFGNGLTAVYAFHPETGQMEGTCVSVQGSDCVGSGTGSTQDIVYEYDAFGNLVDQDNRYMGVSESFAYDNLHRITRAQRSNSNSVNYAYDALGNFRYKSDYSKVQSDAYQYGAGNAGPNAVTRVRKLTGGWASFSYDANGNLVNGDGLNITYDPFNKPVRIVRSGSSADFDYDPDQQRYRQVRDGGQELLYIDKLYEREGNRERLYVGGYLILERNGGGVVAPKYRHTDRLGSTDVITEGTGLVATKSVGGQEERYGYAPFGKPREADWTDGDSKLGSDVTDRGFTEHEHLDSLGLIHMNGRAYDYNLGRFLSVDPLIQDVENTQAHNPYSYIGNNPLSGTDPTGYRSVCNLGGTRRLGCGHPPVSPRLVASIRNGALGSGNQPQAHRVSTGASREEILGPTWEEDEYEEIQSERQTRLDNLRGLGGAVSEAGDVIDPLDPINLAGGLLGKTAKTAVRLKRIKNRIDDLQFNMPIKGGGRAVDHVETPRATAYQSSSKAALEARKSVSEGQPLYRIGTTGISRTDDAQHWMLENPLDSGVAERYGIPIENVLNANFIEVGTIRPGAQFVTRPAPGVGKHGGGAIEVVPEVNGVSVRRFVFDPDIAQ